MRTVANGKISMILNLLENQNNIISFENKHITLFIDNYPWTKTNIRCVTSISHVAGVKVRSSEGQTNCARSGTLWRWTNGPPPAGGGTDGPPPPPGGIT